MHRWVIAVGISAVLATAGAARPAAQSASTQQSAKPAILTVTGCLRSGVDPDTYILANLKWKAPAPPGGTAGTTAAAESAAPSAAASATSLRLVGGPAVRLADHVGHMVEVTGILTDESAPAPGDGDAARRARTGTGGDQTMRDERAKTGMRPEQTLSVRTVRALGSECAPGAPR
jgi:hypothetical protein